MTLQRPFLFSWRTINVYYRRGRSSDKASPFRLPQVRALLIREQLRVTGRAAGAIWRELLLFPLPVLCASQPGAAVRSGCLGAGRPPRPAGRGAWRGSASAQRRALAASRSAVLSLRRFPSRPPSSLSAAQRVTVESGLVKRVRKAQTKSLSGVAAAVSELFRAHLCKQICNICVLNRASLLQESVAACDIPCELPGRTDGAYS